MSNLPSTKLPVPQLMELRMDQITFDKRNELFNANSSFEYIPIKSPEISELALLSLAHTNPIGVEEQIDRGNKLYKFIYGFRTFQILVSQGSMSYTCMVHVYKKLKPEQVIRLMTVDTFLSKILYCPNNTGLALMGGAIREFPAIKSALNDLTPISTVDDIANLFGFTKRTFENHQKSIKNGKQFNKNFDPAQPVHISLGLEKNLDVVKDDDEI
jgi:hypothetical protein